MWISLVAVLASLVGSLLVGGPAAADPGTVGTVTLSGEARVGAELTATTDGWDPEAVLAYQWAVAGIPTPGAVAGAFVVPPTALGKRVTVTVTATKEGTDPATQRSAASARVRFGLLTAPVPTISGGFELGNVARVEPGVWGPGTVSLSYRWLRDGLPISGATGVSYTIARSDRGHTVSVQVTGVRSGYATVTRVSTDQRDIGSLETTVDVGNIGDIERVGGVTIVTYTHGSGPGYPVMAPGEVFIASAEPEFFPPTVRVRWSWYHYATDRVTWGKLASRVTADGRMVYVTLPVGSAWTALKKAAKGSGVMTIVLDWQEAPGVRGQFKQPFRF